MLVTRQTDYAVRCILYLARGDGQVANVTEVAKSMHIPKSFLAKIFQRLVRAGLVVSTRGMSGGFRLARKPSAISLLDIMTAIQGPPRINTCAVDRRKCSFSSSCSVHPVWIGLREELNDRLRGQTIEQLMTAK